MICRYKYAHNSGYMLYILDIVVINLVSVYVVANYMLALYIMQVDNGIVIMSRNITAPLQ